jgi:hygromycin-B 7''-O-kinase
MLLPQSPAPDEWPSLRRGFDGWPALMREICARHGLNASQLAPTESGTNVVFTTVQHVVKLFPPMWSALAAGERAILDHLAGRLSLDTPRLVAAGRLDAWPYVVITRLPGIPLDQIWNALAAADRRSLSAQLGCALRELHAVPLGGLADVPVLADRWSRLVSRSVDETIAHHRRQGVDAAWLDQLRVFLQQAPPLGRDGFTPVLLHADIHPWHLLASRTDAGWRLSGVIDFDSAMLGRDDYEFASPGVLMFAGDAASIAACLSAYGFAASEVNAGLRRRLMVYAVLNRYWGLDVMQEANDRARGCTTLEDLERAIFALGESV